MLELVHLLHVFEQYFPGGELVLAEMARDFVGRRGAGCALMVCTWDVGFLDRGGVVFVFDSGGYF